MSSFVKFVTRNSPPLSALTASIEQPFELLMLAVSVHSGDFFMGRYKAGSV